MNDSTKILDLMHQGGWVMWALLLYSVVTIAIGLERAIILRRARLDPGPLLTHLQETLFRRRSLEDALKVCNAREGAIHHLATLGVRRFQLPTERLEKSLEHQGSREIRRLRRGLGVLATVAGTAPLLGFLGTVMGMMASFDVIGTQGTANPSAVAMGIKEALVTTAAGLIVAVPAQLIHNALAGRVERIGADLEEVGNFLLEAREEWTGA